MGILYHYIKITFRNMLKYYQQTLTNIIGLAVGFICFGLATLWVVYEVTYDNFHKNSRNMYVVYNPDYRTYIGSDNTTSYLLGSYLKETFPEIAYTSQVNASASAGKITVNGVDIPGLTIQADSSFIRMFAVKIIEGSRDFLIPDNNQIAITREKARQLFGNEHPIGKTITAMDREFSICAIISGMSKRSNYAYDLITSFSSRSMNSWNSLSGNTIIELLPGTNIEAFEKKLYEHDRGSESYYSKNLTIKPITKMRYTDPKVVREFKFQHILLFAVSGFLVILCSLFNFLTFFVSSFHARQKELALRKVCGASDGSLMILMSIELILIFLISIVLGCILMQLAYKPFMSLSNIQMSFSAVYLKMLVYFGTVILVSLITFYLLLPAFKRATLSESIHRSNKNNIRKTFIVSQLLISIGFSFCTIVIFKQLYFLNHTSELGFTFQNRGVVRIDQADNGEALENQLKQIPEITRVINTTGYVILLNQTMRMNVDIMSWDDKPADVEFINFHPMYVFPEYIEFNEFQLVEGEMLMDDDLETNVLLNESAVKAFGWHQPIGKKFGDKYTVKGVIKNIYNFMPTVEALPAFYYKPNQSGFFFGRNNVISYMFEYQEGMWKSCEEKIKQLIQANYASTNTTLLNLTEEYNKLLKSEKSLIKALSFISEICILICVFGFVSLVSLTCRERRKSIAIRKINGAMASDILNMFAKEYFLLLIIGAVIAFSSSYFIMQRWLQNFIKQTNIPIWIYAGITFVMAMVIILCVGWQVYRVSVENPLESLKSD